ncbi:dipeptidase C [Arctopsyche grandis]|uniref:dipeptidase C n=1 Tax=Arctopsyche grandis TaxID=121162 RepID=UPI00406DA0E9
MAKAVERYWSMGPGTHQVPLSMFAENRKRMASQVPSDVIVVMQGGGDLNLYDTDVEYVFRQESYFTWACGVREPGCYLAVQGGTGVTTLFVPHLPDSYAIWSGPLLTLDQFKDIYKVDEVNYVEDIAKVLKDKNPSKLYTLKGRNSDSGLETADVHFEGIEQFTVDNKPLYLIATELRVVKTDMEKEVMRYVAKVSSDAHKEVMLYALPERTEYQCESVFLGYCYEKGGCRHVSYTCICGSGCNSAILHYGHAGAPNSRIIQDGDMCLFDMGANYAGYAADITCTFPVNGKFTEDQKFIYNAVLEARNAVIREAKPGVPWPEMHLLANRVMLQKLKEGGLLKGEVEDMIKARLNGVFQPHGLGHLLGLDVHDVGGYLPDHPTRPEPPLDRLRTSRVLKAGMVVTVEPGCYFIDPLLDEALSTPAQAAHIVPEVLARFRGSGGVRIEDDVLITEDGNENLTFVPRTVEEIEEWMSKGANFLKK